MISRVPRFSSGTSLFFEFIVAADKLSTPISCAGCKTSSEWCWLPGLLILPHVNTTHIRADPSQSYWAGSVAHEFLSSCAGTAWLACLALLSHLSLYEVLPEKDCQRLINCLTFAAWSHCPPKNSEQYRLQHIRKKHRTEQLLLFLHLRFLWSDLWSTAFLLQSICLQKFLLNHTQTTNI